MDNRNTKRRCSGGEQSVNSFVSVPEEIVEEIMANLWVKSLMRFKCVSKSWRDLIDTKIFINKHLQNAKGRGVAVAVDNEYCSIIGDISCFRFNEPNNDDPLEGGWIIGCCNGVLCILNNGHFFLSNPATRILKRLPTFNFVAEAVVWLGWTEVRCGFGWDEESDAYKVFLCTNDGYGASFGKVYSSKTNSWNKVECGRLSFGGAPEHIEVGVLASGKIHWVPERDCIDNYDYVDCIEYFDFKSEVFGSMKLPSEPQGGVGRWWLRERDGCLNALYNHNNDNKGQRRTKRLFRTIVRREAERPGSTDAAYFAAKLQELEEEEEEEAELFDVWVMEESWVKKKANVPILKSTLEYQRYVYVESLISPACD